MSVVGFAGYAQRTVSACRALEVFECALVLQHVALELLRLALVLLQLALVLLDLALVHLHLALVRFALALVLRVPALVLHRAALERRGHVVAVENGLLIGWAGFIGGHDEANTKRRNIRSQNVPKRAGA
jgi:hypothetical protein